MSNTALNWMIKFRLDPTAKHILMVMANRVKDQSPVYDRPIGELIEETSLHRATILWCLRYLAETEVISVLSKPGMPGIFRLNLEKQPKADIPTQRRVRQVTQSPIRQVKTGNPESNTTPPSALDTRGERIRRYHPESNTTPLTLPNKENQKKPVTSKKPSAATERRETLHGSIVGWLKSEHPDIGLLPRDHKALKVLLAAQPEMTLEKFREYWARFVNSPVPYERQQGPALMFFCLNINRFTRERTNGNATTYRRETPGEATERYNDEQQRLLQSYLDEKANRSLRSIGSGSTSDDLRGSS